jgi:hypothetical protein
MAALNQPRPKTSGRQSTLRLYQVRVYTDDQIFHVANNSEHGGTNISGKPFCFWRHSTAHQ